MALTKAQEDVLTKLAENTHVFWKAEYAISCTEPFGFECRTSVVKADPSDPKGLTLDNGATEAVGASTWDITRQILMHLNLTSESKFGRGSQVRADIEAIREHFTKKSKPA